ncbi:glucose-6-phosphate dehydrogenase [Frondihabitans australicus]|uniref:Glucose-6-phosphate 1-dehydrogenase n=1 Tax=Frondihabitans australicus TaxID=386892 RepID=A0A495IES9_9MICO|nr:glucose-6-phosphate dehydrogenase [Frondihabitans australicus]RKR73861.1 glucose-6-phosphate 1-dehydrogenase [Frondihabitans australicus]
MTETTTLIILGASGDLTERLLLPGLASLLKSDRGVDVKLIGTGRSARSPKEWDDVVKTAFNGDAGSDLAKRTLASSEYIQGDPTDPAHLEKLFEASVGEPVMYFALPPAISTRVIKALEKVKLPEGLRLALEKPFGSDEAEAKQLNQELLKVVPEERIHRTDHFLGRSTVLDIIGLRFANRLFEPVWNSDNIEKVEIFYDEVLGLEGRAQYYDKAGALVDMIQSHLLQILAIIAMEAPASIDAVELRSEIARVLRATWVKDGDPVTSSRRGQYTAGTISGKDVPSYSDEEGVDNERQTETLAEVEFEVKTRRWAGVPFILRSGKGMTKIRKEVLITFKPVPVLPAGLTGATSPDTLRIEISPETLELGVTTNGKGNPLSLEKSVLKTDLGKPELTPYGEVLSGIFHDDPTLSIRGDVAERCWAIVAPVIAAWEADMVPLEKYPAGSSGPAEWKTSQEA